MSWISPREHPEWDNKSLEEEEKGGMWTITIGFIVILFWVLVVGVWWGSSLYQPQAPQVEASIDQK